MAEWKRPGTNLVYTSAYKKPRISWDEHEKRDREEFEPRHPFKRYKRQAEMGPIEQWQARDPWRQRLKPGRFDVELKWLDQNKSFGTVSATGAVEDSINHLVQSDGQSERIGRSAIVHSINWRYNLKLPRQDDVGNAKEGDIVRIILFLDKQCNGAAAGVTDILETAVFKSFNNLANKDRFHIVYDQTHVLNYLAIASDATAGSVAQAPVLMYTSTYKSVNTQVEFTGTTGAITEITSNNYGFLIISRSGIASMESAIRIRFTG